MKKFRKKNPLNVNILKGKHHVYWHNATVNCLVQSSYAVAASVSTGMSNHISMFISGNSPSDETLNRNHCRCSCDDSMNFPL